MRLFCVVLFVALCLSVLCSGDAVRQSTYMKASNAQPNAEFGKSLSLSADGSTMCVCAPKEPSSFPSGGALYVFKKNSTNQWTQLQFIPTTVPIDSFCSSCAISGDALFIAVGHAQDGSGGSGFNTNATVQNVAPASGAAYIFAFDGVKFNQALFIKSPNVTANSSFGFSVALDRTASVLAVGAYGEDAVYVYARNGAVWRFQQQLKAGIGQFGKSVSLSSDGFSLAVGAPQEDGGDRGIDPPRVAPISTNSGAAFFFSRLSSVANFAFGNYIKASNNNIYNYNFGFSVALSGDGLSLAVGAHQETCNSSGLNGDQFKIDIGVFYGAAYLFTRPDTQTKWNQTLYVKPLYPDANGGRFGTSVSLSYDGGVLLVGSGSESSLTRGIGNIPSSFLVGNKETGAAYLLFRTPSGAWNHSLYIKSSNLGTGDRFCDMSAAVSADAKSAVCGSFFESNGARGIDGDFFFGTRTHSGAAYVFSTGLSIAIPTSVAVGTTVTVPGPYVVPPDQVFVVAGTLNVQGPLTVSGQLVVAPGGQVTSTSLTISGNVTVSTGSQIAVSGPVTITPGSLLSVVVSSPGTTTVATYDTAPFGTFSNVTALSSPSVSTCQSPVNPPQTSYGNTALTVTVSFVNACGGSSALSAGAIAGIVVGSVVGAMIVVFGVVAAVMYTRKRRDLKLRATLSQKQTAQLKASEALAL